MTTITDKEARTIYDLRSYGLSGNSVYEPKRMREAWPFDRQIEDINRNISRLVRKGLATELGRSEGYTERAYRLSPAMDEAYQDWYRRVGFNVVEKW